MMRQFDREPYPVSARPALRLCGFLLLAILGQTVSGEEPLLANAVEKQDHGAIGSLLDRKVDVDTAQADGMTALLWAAYTDDQKVAEAIVLAGADVNLANRYGVTPLSLACVNGNAEIVRLLLDQGADPNAKLAGGETPLLTASRTGRIESVRELLDKGAEVNAKEERGQTALMWAAAEGHDDVVGALLDAGADFKTTLDSGFTAMLFAVRQGHTPVVKRLLAAGDDVNAAARPKKTPAKGLSGGISPLLLAIENGHFELALELLQAGADPNDQRTGFAPLHTLSWVRKPPIGDNADGDPPPIGSGSLTSLQFARALVQHGADVNLQKKSTGRRGKYGKKGTTAFLCAAGTGDVAFLQTLLELGADPKITNQSGWTPLMMAAGIGTGSSGDSAGTEEECLEAVKWLIDLGADVNAVDRNGETAMHGAAYKMMPSVVNYLAQSGSDVHIWSKPARNGRMPLWIAQGYRGGGNFKPSYETVAAIRELMIAEGIDPPPPPKQKREKGYRAN